MANRKSEERESESARLNAIVWLMLNVWNLTALFITSAARKISTEPKQFLHDIDQLFEYQTTRQRLCKVEKMQIEKLWNLDNKPFMYKLHPRRPESSN